MISDKHHSAAGLCDIRSRSIHCHLRNWFSRPSWLMQWNIFQWNRHDKLCIIWWLFNMSFDFFMAEALFSWYSVGIKTVYLIKYVSYWALYWFLCWLYNQALVVHMKHQGCFIGNGAILPQCQWSKLVGYGKNVIYQSTIKKINSVITTNSKTELYWHQQPIAKSKQCFRPTCFDSWWFLITFT